MNSIRERLRLSGISVRQFLVMLVFVGSVMFFFLFREMKQEMNSQEQMVIGEMQERLKLADLYLDYFCDSILGSLTGVTMRSDLYEEGDGTTYFSLNEIRKNNECIRTLYVVQQNGYIASSSQALYDAVRPEVVDAMAERARQNPGRVQYSAPVYSSMAAGYSFYVSYMGNGHIAVAEAGCEHLREILQPVLEGQGRYYMIREPGGEAFLFSRDGQEVELKERTYPLEVADRYRHMFGEDFAPMEFYEAQALPESCFMFTNSNKLRWEIYLLLPRDVLQTYRAGLYRSTAVHMGVWFFGVTVIAFWFTMLYTNPLRRLARDMDRVNDLEQLVEVRYSREDELGRLSAHYNGLVRRIRTLVEEIRETEHKKLEYEFLMLQNQIGPHFLHNTLACVASLIRQEKYETAQQALRALIRLLSYTFELNEKTVTLREEIEQIGNYMKIQQMRYGQELRFEQQIDDAACQGRVLKLLLQPLVENSVFHGIAPRGGGTLKIVARLRGDVLHIFICDDGVGMTREMCRDILSGKTIARVTDRLSSVGILNVHERLKLRYGEKYGISIKSEIGIGTVICLRIPQGSAENVTERS